MFESRFDRSRLDIPLVQESSRTVISQAMVPIMQSPFPVVSTEHFSFGPNERLTVQDFLRDLTRSSRTAKDNLRPPDQEIVKYHREPLTLPPILKNAANPDQLQLPPTSVSDDGQCPLRQPSASKESNTRKQNVLRPDSYLDRAVINTRSPRIVHTYSKKLKGIPPELPTSEIVPPPPSPSARLGDQQQDASVCMGSAGRTRFQGKPGTHPDEHIQLPSPSAANVAIPKTSEQKSKRTARGNIDNAEQEQPAKGKKRRRRAPVGGLVLIHRIFYEVACSSEPEVSCPLALSDFSRKVLLRIIVFHIVFYPCEEDRKLTTFSMNEILREALTLTATLSRV